MTRDWKALKRLKFGLPDGRQLIVEPGQRIPQEAWDSCTPRQIAQLQDGYQRMTTEVAE